MNKAPRFSIVVPTKDRPMLALSAVQSVLRQNRTDLELIVVDNASSEAQALGERLPADPRVRRIRTGNLAMHANWQRGWEEAEGEIVLFVEDKIELADGCLAALDAAFSSSAADYIVYYIATSSRHAAAGNAVPQPLDLAEMLSLVRECRLDAYAKNAPRAINTAFRRSYAVGATAERGRLCRPMSPDYSLGAFLLGGGGRGFRLFEKLSVVKQGPSLGSDYSRGGAARDACLREFGGSIGDLVAGLPSQSLLFGNTLLGELLIFLEGAGIPRRAIEPEEDAYWLLLLSEALIAAGHGVADEANAAFCEVRSKPALWRLRFSAYLLRRYLQGWPNRKKKMRQNFRPALQALRCVWIPRPRCVQ